MPNITKDKSENKVIAKTIKKKTIRDDDVNKEVVQSTSATNVNKKKIVREVSDDQQEVVVKSIAVANKTKNKLVHDVNKKMVREGSDVQQKVVVKGIADVAKKTKDISVQKSIKKDIKNTTEETIKSKPISKLGTKSISKQDKVNESNYKYMLFLFINCMN